MKPPAPDPIALGKDPLRSELTPYEILGVGRDVTSKEVQTAFKAALLRRAHLPRLTAAKLALERPVQRGLLDCFLYDPAALRTLDPCPLDDPDALAPERRAATAAAWEAQLCRHFPDLPTAHSLAVLWYWWAALESAPERDDAPALGLRWRRALCYWALLLAHEEFWRTTPEGLGQALLEKLRSELRKLPVPTEPEPGCAIPSDLDALLESELESGRALYAAGLSTANGRVSAGGELLGALGALPHVRERLEDDLEREPGNSALQELREKLDALGPVRTLVESRRLVDARVALERLPESERERPEARALRARIGLELGREQASVQRMDQALDSWEQALCAMPEGEVATALRSEIVSASRTRAAALASRPDEARTLLERAYALVPDDTLALPLGLILHRSGAALARQVVQTLEAESGVSAECVEKLDRAAQELQRAAELGAPEAGEDAAFVQSLLDQCATRAGALEAFSHVIWTTSQPSVDLRRRLSVLLCNRAVAATHRAMQLATDLDVRQYRARREWLERLRARRAEHRGELVLCDDCDQDRGGQLFRFECLGEPAFRLCPRCTRRSRSFRSTPDEDPVPLLECAEDDLEQAALLHAGETLQSNLEDVRSLLDTLRTDPTAATQAGLSRFAGRWMAAIYLGSVLILLLYFFHDLGSLAAK